MKVERFTSNRLVFSICLAVICVLCLVSPSSSEADDKDESFSLTVTIQSRHISNFEVCIPVKVGEPFRVVWGNEKTKDGMSGVLRPPDGGEYPLSLSISEGGGSCQETTVPKLKLGEPHEWGMLVSSLFNHYDRRKVVLSKGSCQ